MSIFSDFTDHVQTPTTHKHWAHNFELILWEAIACVFINPHTWHGNLKLVNMKNTFANMCHKQYLDNWLLTLHVLIFIYGTVHKEQLSLICHLHHNYLPSKGILGHQKTNRIIPIFYIRRSLPYTNHAISYKTLSPTLLSVISFPFF